MKKTLTTLAFGVVTSVAFAADYSTCELRYNACEKPRSCADFYICEQQEQQQVNVLVLKAIRELDFDKRTLCTEKRTAIESSIEAHATTIECHDTETGPVFGG